jgi:hypothetical protein
MIVTLLTFLMLVGWVWIFLNWRDDREREREWKRKMAAEQHGLNHGLNWLKKDRE